MAREGCWPPWKRPNPQSSEDRFIDITGRIFPAACACGPLHQGDNVSGAIIEVRDITEDKLAEKERIELLHAQVRARHEAPVARRFLSIQRRFVSTSRLHS
jgi:hypothetical protein